MDSAQAKQLTDLLIGKSVGDWKVVAPIDAGKSAVVVRAERDGEIAAVKVFHPELVERFGKAIQLERIEREKQLIGVSHPNLVRILDGGECSKTGHLFVVMEFLPWSNLAKKIGEIQESSLRSIVAQLASAAMFLEEKGLVHRDIKPENIAINDNLQEIKLLDLGVLRPIGDSNLTDADQRPFIGTLRYSSPEFLKRQEEPNLEGWRAVTFYQIGAVIHDLLTKEQIFNEYIEPFSLVVEAVLNKNPTVWGDDPLLLPLCRHCLHKNPKTRLELVKWSDFSSEQNSLAAASEALEKIKNRQKYSKQLAGPYAPSPAEINRIRGLRLNDLCNRLETRISILLNSLQCFPPRATTSHRDLPKSKIIIQIQFEKNEELALNSFFSIHFEASLIDDSGAEPVYQMAISAQISPIENEFPAAMDCLPIQAGSADELLADPALEAHIVRALEAAYEMQDAHSKNGLSDKVILNLKNI